MGAILRTSRFRSRERQPCEFGPSNWQIWNVLLITLVFCRLRGFFDHLHHSIPLFRKQKLLEQYQSGTINRALLLTILTVTAKILDLPDLPNIDDCLRGLLSSDPFVGAVEPAVILDAFRQSCLLTFYRFHQLHGEDAWEHVSKLTRKAYQMGLHQLDPSDGYAQRSNASLGSKDMEEWRYVWWCIYCLDSYSNIMAATPFVVEGESIRTSLVSTSLESPEENQQDLSAPRLFLPPQTQFLWKVTLDTGKLETPGSYFNMHIVTTTILREAGNIYRLRQQNPSESLYERHACFKDHVLAVTFSLPPAFLNEARDVFANEDSVHHHARLVCLLHLHTARLLNAMSFDDADEMIWLKCWQEALIHCQGILAVIRQWDSRYCSTVDPAICLIVFWVLIMLHLHSVQDGQNTQIAFRERLEAEKTVLLLFLGQFARIWALPRVLKGKIRLLPCQCHIPEVS